MTFTERVSVMQAAKEIGVAPQLVRERMKCAKTDPLHWDLGEVVETGSEKKKYTYLIFRAKLDRFLGRGVPNVV